MYYDDYEKVFTLLETFYVIDKFMLKEGVSSLKYQMWAKKNYKSLTLSELYNLKKLDLTFLGMLEVPDNLGLLENLEELDLSGNRLTSLPKDIYNLNNLKILNLGSNIYGGNNISELSKDIYKLYNLEGLSVVNTDITELPIEILTLENLSYIRISDDKLANSDVVKLLSAQGCAIDYTELFNL